MIYINYLQAKLFRAGSNRKGPVIVNNLPPHFNVPIRKNWNLHPFALHTVSMATLILMGPL